jgi:hypothetical protein
VALEQPRKAACPSWLTAAPLSVLRLLRLDIGEAARSFEQHLDELGLLVAQEALEFGTVDRGSASLRLLHQVGEDGAAHFDCVGDRDRKAAELWLPS